MKSANLNFLEPSGLLQACNGTDLPFLPSADAEKIPDATATLKNKNVQ